MTVKDPNRYRLFKKPGGELSFYPSKRKVSPTPLMKNFLLRKRRLLPLACNGLKRLGPAEDGGYVVPIEQVTQSRFLVSLGLAEDWRFDKDFLALNSGVTMVAVDHTVGRSLFGRGIVRCLWKIPMYALLFQRAKRDKWNRRLHTYAEYFNFFAGRHRHLRKRVVGAKRDSFDITLTEILDSCSPSGEHDVFLKADIEGSEYEIVADIIKSQNRICCIAAEVHQLDVRTEEFFRLIDELSQHFSIVHIHGNNCGGYDDRLDFPATVEITLINNDLLFNKLEYSKETYPRPGLDAPNDPSLPDYKLHF